VFEYCMMHQSAGHDFQETLQVTAFFGGWIVPTLYAVGFALTLWRPGQAWKVALAVGALGVIGTLLVAAGTLLWTSFSAVSVDKLGLTGALLVSLLGWVIIRYSARYLDGEPNQERFVRAMLFTLAAVNLLVVSQHLLVIVLAWTATSIGLHFLLTHYQERKAAQIVAHKKFIASRLADLCLVIALVLVYQASDSLTLAGLNASINRLETLPVGLHWAAALFALAAILKSAQLPLHGWLIQVMEAPTPVSALLHAGIVNIGGFVLIRMAELISLAPAAQTLLVLTGSVTAVLASLVMMTRISIKVRLAWSTCAQMGFMLLEVGLGLYELALLHLVAHSLYKAHAFLSAGDRVETARSHDLFINPGTARALPWYLGAALISGMLVAGSAGIWRALLPDFTVPAVALAIVALGLAPLLWLEQGAGLSALLRGGARVVGLTQLYLLWHALFAGLAPTASAAAPALLVWVMLSFGALYATQVWLRRYPQGRLAETLYPWAYCGFYLDETFTRLTFKLWPARLSPLQARTLVNRNPAQQGDTL
jgi:NAD(P)H-quinone oxidoreductase subunit 5